MVSPICPHAQETCSRNSLRGRFILSFPPLSIPSLFRSISPSLSYAFACKHKGTEGKILLLPFSLSLSLQIFPLQGEVSFPSVFSLLSFHFFFSCATEKNSITQEEVLPLSLSSLTLPHLLHRTCFSPSTREIGEKMEVRRERIEERENSFFLSAHSFIELKRVDRCHLRREKIRSTV